MLLGMTLLGDVPVKVSPHTSLNFSKGVVRSRDLARCSKEEIICGLKNQGVTAAAGQLYPLNLSIVIQGGKKTCQHLTVLFIYQ